jgi:hypothetical protein
MFGVAVENVLGVDRPARGSRSLSCRDLGHPSVFCQAQEGRSGGLSSDACQECHPADVGLHSGLEGAEREDAQDVEDAAVSWAAPAGPAARRGVRALLYVAHVRGDRVGAAVEGGVIADLTGAGGDVPYGLVPLPGEDRCLFAASTRRAAAGGRACAHVLEAGCVVDERGDVGVVPPGGGRADENAPQLR